MRHHADGYCNKSNNIFLKIPFTSIECNRKKHVRIYCMSLCHFFVCFMSIQHAKIPPHDILL